MSGIIPVFGSAGGGAGGGSFILLYGSSDVDIAGNYVKIANATDGVIFEGVIPDSVHAANFTIDKAGAYDITVKDGSGTGTELEHKTVIVPSLGSNFGVKIGNSDHMAGIRTVQQGSCNIVGQYEFVYTFSNPKVTGYVSGDYTGNKSVTINETGETLNGVSHSGYAPYYECTDVPSGDELAKTHYAVASIPISNGIKNKNKCAFVFDASYMTGQVATDSAISFDKGKLPQIAIDGLYWYNSGGKYGTDGLYPVDHEEYYNEYMLSTLPQPSRYSTIAYDEKSGNVDFAYAIPGNAVRYAYAPQKGNKYVKKHFIRINNDRDKSNFYGYDSTSDADKYIAAHPVIYEKAIAKINVCGDYTFIEFY